MKKNTKIAVVVGGVVLLAVLLLIFGGKPSSTVGYIPPALTESRASSTVGVVAVKLFSAAYGAQYRSITNTGSVPIFIAKTSASSTITSLTGMGINASSTYEMIDAKGNLWVGEIWALTITGTSTVATSQL